MAKPTHIFVVGLSRTGTNMMRKILNTSDEIALCGETHYLKHWMGYEGFQREFASVADISSDAGLDKLVDYIYNLRDNQKRARSFWRWVQNRIDPDTFRQRLQESSRDSWAPLEVVMDYFAEGKPIQGDKTPAHLYAVPELLERYPRAKIVHMFRDLRAIFVSEKRWQMSREFVTFPYGILRRSELLLEIFLSFHALLTWLRAVQLHYQYQQRFPENYYLCRFENVVSDPAVELKRISEFLGIDFTDAMLEISYQNSTVRAQQQSQGLDASAASRWQQHMNPITNRWLLFWSKKHLIRFGYQVDNQPS